MQDKRFRKHHIDFIQIKIDSTYDSKSGSLLADFCLRFEILSFWENTKAG